ncbi:MAG: hypothetical protein E3J90_03755 [Promethearchaeota archaeon]|nr:MAG: hypothetical protein E3J90_03755 [Candidatus Lokiarchaeota archaeon]
MSSSFNQKIIDKLRKGYAPVEQGPKANLTSTYKNIFKPLVNRKDFTLLFELFDTNEVVLRAWSFLGLHHVLEETSVYEEERITKIQKIILDVLNDSREISYYGDSIELRTSLREHHVRRICELNKKLNFKPAFDYCLSFDKVTDSVVSDLIENVVSKTTTPNVESLILRLANNTSIRDFHLKNQMVKSFENLSQEGDVIKVNEIASLFKSYITQINEDKITDQEFLKNVKSLQENIFRVGAILGLSLEEETLEFVDSLRYPYGSLYLIAKRYYNNDRLVSIILKKLEESKNPNFIAEILKAVLVLKDKIENWEKIIIENVRNFQIVDGSLINDMQESNLIDQELIVNLLNEGDKWSLEFIRESLNDNPEMLEQWQDVKNEFIKILKLTTTKTSDEKNALLKKKEMILKVTIDLQVEELVNICLENLQSFEDKNLKKLAVFSILKFAEESLLLELKELMKKDADLAKVVLNLIDILDRNEWKFFY